MAEPDKSLEQSKRVPRPDSFAQGLLIGAIGALTGVCLGIGGFYLTYRIVDPTYPALAMPLVAGWLAAIPSVRRRQWRRMSGIVLGSLGISCCVWWLLTQMLSHLPIGF